MVMHLLPFIVTELKSSGCPICHASDVKNAKRKKNDDTNHCFINPFPYICMACMTMRHFFFLSSQMTKWKQKAHKNPLSANKERIKT